LEQGGSEVAMRQLADNGALLIAILAPSITGIYMLRAESFICSSPAHSSR